VRSFREITGKHMLRDQRITSGALVVTVLFAPPAPRGTGTSLRGTLARQGGIPESLIVARSAGAGATLKL
jgi:hypothetical protein